MVLLILLIFMTITFILFYLRMRKVTRYQKLTANIPEVKSFPVIGSVLAFRKTEMLSNIDKFMVKFGNISKSWLGPYFLIGLTSPEIIGEILSNDKLIDKPNIYYYFFPLVEPSTIFVSSGNLWRKRRKQIAPAFHFQMFEGYIDVFNANSRIFIENLKIELGKSSFNICHYNNFCTLDIISEMVLGVEPGIQKQRNMEIVEAFQVLEKAFIHRVTRPWLWPNVTFFMSPVGKKARQRLKLLYDFIDKILELRNSKFDSGKKYPQPDGNEDADSKSVDVKKGKELYTILLELQDNGSLSHKELKDELLTMIIGGYSTISSALSFAMYCLMKNQDVQEKVVGELNDIVNGSDRDFTMSDLQKMPYLEMVIKETLRLYSAAPVVTREIKEDVHLKSGYILPKGALVSLLLYNMHRRPDLYPNPEHFDPERFNKENSYKRNFYAFTPFSGGSRICTGHRFAILEIKVLLSHILRKYKLLSPTDDSPDIRLAHEMVLRSTTGVHIRIENR